jgi:serine/threonine-protein kinase HipA
VSPDLTLISGHQIRKAPSVADSCSHFAMADTAPDAWGRRVILREHAKRRKVDATKISAKTRPWAMIEQETA